MAFITVDGLQLFKEVFRELKERNVKGRILTTDYLCFTQPKALEEIRDLFPNIQVRMYKCEALSGFHTKGYLIRQGKVIRIIIGSSNMTERALSFNKEWNSEHVADEEDLFGKAVLSEFERLWDKSSPFNDYLNAYIQIYK